MPEQSPLSVGRASSDGPDLLSVVQVDQWGRWQRGDRRAVEDYLRDAPQLGDNAEAVLGLIVSELLLRRQHGESPPAEEYCRRFPAYAAELRHVLEAQQSLCTGARAEHDRWQTRLSLGPVRSVAASEPSGLASVPAPPSTRPPGPEQHLTAGRDVPQALLVPGHDLLQELGRGGMGVVYLAYDRQRRETVALKTMRQADPAALYHFKQEFRALAGVTHPNLVALYELLSDGNHWCFTMEYVVGVNFLGAVRTEAPTEGEATPPTVAPGQAVPPDAPAVRAFPPRQAGFHAGRLRDCLQQLVAGVAALHAAGKLHRDVKPSNVLVSRHGRVVLLDFGLVAEMDATARLYANPGQQVVGTVAYMAPEQAAGLPVSPASDWYSVGVMLYEALTGQLPFTGPPWQVALDKQRREPPPPQALATEIPEDLADLCVALLRRDPRERPSGEEVLRRLSSDAPTRARELLAEGARVPSGLLIGRQQHLGALREAFDIVKQGRAVTVCLRGLSGMGKSTLVQFFLDALAERDEALIFRGRCYEQESVPFKALDSLMDAVCQYLGRLPRRQVLGLLPEDAPSLARLFPVLEGLTALTDKSQRVLQIPDLQELRRRGFAALRELLARLGKSRPLVLALDDLQWGDLDSAALLDSVLRPPEAPALLLLASYRAEDVARSPFLRSFLSPTAGERTLPERRELAVEALAPAEAASLAEALLGQEGAGTGRAEVIGRESAGSPLFIAELVRSLESGASAEAAAGTISLEKVLRARVNRLSAEARRLLEVVAVFGQPLRQESAFQAAGLESAARAALVALRAAGLLRSTGLADEHLVETSHDRIRETVAAYLPEGERRHHHRCLAETLEAEGDADDEVLAVHWQGAGETNKAGRYYATAAEQAAAALAFDRAAKLYRLALELSCLSGPEAASLRVHLADALANAGRGAEAAREYLAGAEGSDKTQLLALRQRAAMQFLIGGHMDAGLDVLRSVLSAVGLRIPETPRRALWSLLWQRLLLRIRGLRFRARKARDIPADELARIDVCWTGGIGLGLIDPIRAFAFQARHLRLALRAGDPARVSRALAIESFFVSDAGAANPRRAILLLQEAEGVARGIGDPYGLALVSLCRGNTAYLQGRFKEGHALTDQAVAAFRETCTGVAWEIDTGHTFSLWCLLFLGEVAEMRRRRTTLLREAQDRGDLYAATHLGTYIMAYVRLADDGPEGARQELEQTMARWSQQGFHVQHHNAFLARAHIEVYDGRGTAGWNEVLRTAAAYKSSLLLRVEQCRVDVLQTRARCALAAAQRVADARPLLRAAEQDARRLGREKAAWSRALSSLTLGCVAGARKDPDTAVRHLQEAVAQLDAVDMQLFAAAARRRLGQLLGGDEGCSLVTQADAWMRAQGIVKPSRMAAMLAPGFPGEGV